MCLHCQSKTRIAGVTFGVVNLVYGWGLSTLHPWTDFRGQSPVLLVEPETCFRHLSADMAVYSTWSLGWRHCWKEEMTCWFCNSVCTQVIRMSSKYLQRGFGRRSPELLSDSTFLDTESLAGEKRGERESSPCWMEIWDVTCG